MKEKRDLIRAWIRRAESDLAIVEMCLANEKSLDVASGAREAATTIRDFVLGRLPPDVLKEA